MEDLLAFESALAPAEDVGTDAGAHPSSCSGSMMRGASPGFGSSATKRRRKGFLAFKSPAKTEASGSASDSLGVLKYEGECGSVAPDGSFEAKRCLGCFRSSAHGRCYLSASDKREWASHGRGLWCRDCYTCWRTTYSTDHSLLVFQQWLTDPIHRAEFELSLLSFLSLLREGAGRITMSMVMERSRSLSFMLSVLGLSMAPMAAVSLADAEAMMKSGEITYLDPNSVVPMKDGPTIRLGVLVPASHLQLSMSCAPRLEAPNLPPSLPSRTLLMAAFRLRRRVGPLLRSPRHHLPGRLAGLHKGDARDRWPSP